MLWPLILPIQVTAGLLAACVVVATTLAPVVRCRRLPTFAVGVLLGFIAFIPACNVVMKLIDAKRFGVFTFAHFADIRDPRVERYLPPAAYDLTIEKPSHGNGFHAKYKIDETQLVKYVDNLWEQNGKQSTVPRKSLEGPLKISTEEFANEYGHLGWSPIATAIGYHSPVEPDGGGFTIWYDRSNSTAYERTGYW